jgi:branched-chain amino acid transport system ATP-binding protein
MTEPVLKVVDLVKHFGGVRATDHLSFDVRPGELHAIIGPNGAGKTTLIGQLCGELTSDSGVILFNGSDIRSRSVQDRVALGICRSYQITSIFPDFSVLANVSLAIQSRAGHSYRFWRPTDADHGLTGPARDVLKKVNLDQQSELRAAELSYGEKRALEIAMVLASGPTVLLLDEPTAGMGPEDSASIVRLLRGLKGQHAIVLVEHDMDAVFALADRVTVLVYGRAMVTGTVDEVRGNPEVREAYLGEEQSDHA